MFVDLRSKSLFEKQLTLEIPKNIIPSSEYLEVAVIGRFLKDTCVMYFNF